jgi:hypothetical protein
MQVRGGDGTSFLQGSLEMRVAYDPGWYLSVFFLHKIDIIEFVLKRTWLLFVTTCKILYK